MEYVPPLSLPLEPFISAYRDEIIGAMLIYSAFHVFRFLLTQPREHVDAKEYRKKLDSDSVPPSERETVEKLVAELQQYRPTSKSARTIKRILDEKIGARNY